MKAELIKTEQEFKPIEVKLTIETPNEVTFIQDARKNFAQFETIDSKAVVKIEFIDHGVISLILQQLTKAIEEATGEAPKE